MRIKTDKKVKEFKEEIQQNSENYNFFQVDFYNKNEEKKEEIDENEE